ncbi:hypothetical protein ERD95_12310 [Enterobacteriaceae bacterium ML5]|nr:hypothetical protein ERD95_12310 [Enterobacteriaceae bacterium ML5]
MINEHYVNFGFTLSDKIPKEIALEFVAIRQFAIAVFASLEPHKREAIIDTLSKSESPEMKDIVKNLKLIPKS